MSLTSVLAIVAVCVVLRCEAWPKIGQKANSDANCRNLADNTERCTKFGKFTCAKLDGAYVTGATLCDFCTEYGNTGAIIYHMGDEERRCADLEPNYPVTDDPECEQYFKSKSTYCPESWEDFCGTIPNTDYTAHEHGKCEFCKKYGGKSNLIFYGTGAKCADVIQHLRPKYKVDGQWDGPL